MMAKAINWRSAWPWGRKTPEERLAELSEDLRHLAAREKLFEARVAEMRTDFQRKREQIENDVEIAKRCAKDGLRREAIFYAHKLELLGTDIWSRLESEVTPVALDEIRKLWEERAVSKQDTSEDDVAALGVTEEDIETMAAELLPENEPERKE